MIRLDHVGIVINGTRILEDVSLTVGKGEFVFLTGCSGAGKSTILNLIHGDLIPTSGTVEVQGMDTRHISRRRLPYLRRSVGYIFQDYKLLQEKTALENVEFALEVTGVRRRQIRTRSLHALMTVGLSHRLNHYPADLSGGECQRVAIARAIVLDPPVLLADEPTGNLDADSTRDILDLLRRINRSGTAILMATHKEDLTDSPGCVCLTLTDGRIA